MLRIRGIQHGPPVSQALHLCCPHCFSCQGTMSFWLFPPIETVFFQPCNQKGSAFRTCHWLAPSWHSGLYHMSSLQRHPPCLSFLVLQLASCIKSTAYCHYVAFSISSLWSRLFTHFRAHCLSSQVEQGFPCSLWPFQYLTQGLAPIWPRWRSGKGSSSQCWRLKRGRFNSCIGKIP